MDKYEMHETLLKHVCREIEQLTEQIQKNGSMSSQDLDKLDKMYHLKKSMLTCKAMEDAEDYEDGVPGRRGRSPMTGRYVSRDNGNSYADGYSQGYSEAMSQMNYNNGNSGHYPMSPYPPSRHW